MDILRWITLTARKTIKIILSDLDGKDLKRPKNLKRKHKQTHSAEFNAAKPMKIGIVKASNSR